MDCPGCGEKIYEEELIDGACPLCGRDIEDDDGHDGSINEIVEMFETAEAVSMNAERESVERSFVLHVSPSLADRLKPKKCSACGRWHLRVGEKDYHVETDGYQGSLDVRYLCRLCT
ncbi:MAG: hypothetical protein ACI9QA_000728 [Methanobacteriota archaeon]|jgi:hypothetical protein|uniref:Uncharacterized protein n=1 Tax=Halorutilus salinus TaxID=2487751 RepID=A0A9Q4C3V1_9EURY|nr:hypothetical protein [Halorutilus salinus]MCX2818485.1 hypothetical protein [Halorutilus salinus]